MHRVPLCADGPRLLPSYREELTMRSKTTGTQASRNAWNEIQSPILMEPKIPQNEKILKYTIMMTLKPTQCKNQILLTLFLQFLKALLHQVTGFPPCPWPQILPQLEKIQIPLMSWFLTIIMRLFFIHMRTPVEVSGPSRSILIISTIYIFPMIFRNPACCRPILDLDLFTPHFLMEKLSYGLRSWIN